MAGQVFVDILIDVNNRAKKAAEDLQKQLEQVAKTAEKAGKDLAHNLEVKSKKASEALAVSLEKLKDTAQKTGKQFAQSLHNQATKATQALEKGLKKVSAVALKTGKDLNHSFEDAARQIAIVGAAATAVSVGVLALGTKAAQAAIEKEDALKKLASSLRTAGDYTKDAADNFTNLATKIQETSKFSDIEILNQISLAKSLGATNAQAAKVAQASADMASELGISLNTATTQITKSLTGFGGELVNVAPEIKNLTEDSLKAGIAIDIVSKRFQGAAKEGLNTFSGSLTEMNNAFGGIFEAMGFAIINSSKMKGVIGALSKVFSDLGKWIARNEDALMNYVEIGIKAFLQGVQAAGFVIRLFNQALAGLKIVIRGVVEGFIEAAQMMVDLASKIPFVGDKFSGLKESIADFGKFYTDETEEMIANHARFDESVKKVTENFIVEVGKRTKAAEDAAKRQKKIMEQASPKKQEPSFLSQATGQITKDTMATAASGVISGGDVTDAIAGVASTVAVGMIGPFGKAVGPLVKLMGGSADQMRQTFKNVSNGIVTFISNFITNIPVFFEEILKFGPTLFTKIIGAIPGIIDGFVDGIPAVIEALVMELPNLFTALVQGIPRIVTGIINAIPRLVMAIVRQIPNLVKSFLNAFINGIPELIESLIGGIPDIIQGFIGGIPQIIGGFIGGIPQIISGFIGGIPRIIGGLIGGLPKIISGFIGGIPKIITGFIGEIPRIATEFISKLTGGLGGGGGGGGGIMGFVTNPLGSFGFAQGGYVPKGFPNDQFPARLTSGEFVIDNSLTPKLERFLNSRSNGPGDDNLVMLLTQILDKVSGPMSISTSVEFRQQTLANIILDLNRSNARLA